MHLLLLRIYLFMQRERLNKRLAGTFPLLHLLQIQKSRNSSSKMLTFSSISIKFSSTQVNS